MCLPLRHDAPWSTLPDVRVLLADPAYDSSYGPSCMETMGPQTATDSIRQSFHTRPLNKLSNQGVQMMAPTPTLSEISSIGTTPRTNAQTPMDMSEMMPVRCDKDGLLSPNYTQKQDHWTSYRVVPSVVHTGNTLAPSHGATMSENIISHVVSFASNNSQSPFLLPDFSPAGSIFTSPHHSASKKRAMSTSTLSSEGMDILSLIRSSPSALFLLGSMGSFSNMSPSLSQQLGTLGHLSVRNSSSSNMAGCGATAELEQGQCLDLDMVNSMSNQMVVQQGADPTMYYTGSYHKQELDMSNNSNSSVHIPATSIQQSGVPPNNLISLEASIPPPPPYSQAVQAQASAYDSLQDCCHESLEHVDTKPKGLKQQVCKWIDCNQAFFEREDLVRHIEKQHIDQRRGDDFTCYWQACQRKYKPFNARYKLLIHMRVHSGERPNKCTVSIVSIRSHICCFLMSMKLLRQCQTQDYVKYLTISVSTTSLPSNFVIKSTASLQIKISTTQLNFSNRNVIIFWK